MDPFNNRLSLKLEVVSGIVMFRDRDIIWHLITYRRKLNGEYLPHDIELMDNIDTISSFVCTDIILVLKSEVFSEVNADLFRHVTEFVGGQDFICIDKDIRSGRLQLSCTVDRLTANIDFKFPNKILGFAFCIAPTPFTKETGDCDCKCMSTSTCECMITQDIDTKTTTLVIKDVELTKMFGTYKCEHGSYSKSISVDNSDIISKVGDTALFTKNRDCHTCSGISVCAICIDCKTTYCDVCCNAHTKYNTEHRVCQIQHVARSQKEIVCDSCTKTKADQLCKECWKPKCESCAKVHNHKGQEGTEMMIIYQGPPTLSTQKSEQNIQNMKHLYNISITKEENGDPVRICGISYIEDGRIVIVDSNNRKLIVFKVGKEQLRLPLKEEPRSMTAVTGNRIAITFAYTMEIRIYQIFEETITDDPEIINLPSLELRNLKPFSIAFDKGFFAVEIGEGDDGRVIILDNTKIHTTIFNHNKYAFFTGNTIRLALEVKTHDPLEGHIFVSAMSKKMVSCVDFKGNKLWTVPVPSPRGLVIVPEECTSGKNMVLCSRRCSAIYGLSKNDGTDEILLAKGRIKSPRFVAYNSSDRLLCIQVAKGNDEDELTIYEFSITGASSSDKLLDTKN
ncbi:unnamed protein product [Mytilus coruscus]|uniref:B box-type domain-containing protein n=1 Tax=Mytilus coruscus TaxID=42192 RepID=A0A6J8C9C8_MYTCO|nr:unnamed protein product [Mytilus coruscus]